jgi:peptide-methionine (R)-S-oxide reductase
LRRGSLDNKMRWMKRVAVILLALGAGCSQRPEEGQARGEEPMAGPKAKPKIECSDCETPAVAESSLPATDAEWKKKLTAEQFYILRQRGTERPYTGEYLHHAGDGQYACAGCGQALYDSKTKYDSCGWPSFWDALPGAVATRNDGGSVEAVCSRCEGHLGHIFDDGPKPTGKRH